MQRKIPPLEGQVISTKDFQHSDVCFYWGLVRKQLTASTGGQLQNTVPNRNRHHCVEKQNNYSTHSNQHSKRLASPSSKLGGNKKLEKDEREHSTRSNARSSSRKLDVQLKKSQMSMPI